MAENSSKTRRNFLKTAGTAGIAGLAGCNTLNDGDGSETPDEDSVPESQEDESTDTATSGDDSYSIQASALEYDLTDLATSETNTHDQAYVDDNYSAELGVTVLNNGEEAGLEKLSDLHLEDEEGKTVETTEEGYVPEYAVEDGQELTVRAEVDGETKEETITVNKELPSEFYADARIKENGEVLYDTDWNTPYSFDNHIVDRQAFLNQRAERRNELADDDVISESDQENFDEEIEKLRDGKYGDFGEKELIERFFGSIWSAIEGLSVYEGSEANVNSNNMEKAMLDNFDYRPVFVGGFSNPKEPNVPSAGDGDGVIVDSQVAYVDGDWYHVGQDVGDAAHISEIDEIGMVEEGTNFENTSASELGVSILGEFERGNTELENYEDADRRVETAVTSPVTLNGNMTELELSDDISWNTLDEIRENTGWDSVMVPMELATAIGTETEASVEMEGESTRDSRIRISQ